MDKPCPTPAKTYQQASIGEALDKDYGVVKGGPSRNRRAGMIVMSMLVNSEVAQGTSKLHVGILWAAQAV